MSDMTEWEPSTDAMVDALRMLGVGTVAMPHMDLDDPETAAEIRAGLIGALLSVALEAAFQVRSRYPQVMEHLALGMLAVVDGMAEGFGQGRTPRPQEMPIGDKIRLAHAGTLAMVLADLGIDVPGPAGGMAHAAGAAVTNAVAAVVGLEQVAAAQHESQVDPDELAQHVHHVREVWGAANVAAFQVIGGVHELAQLAAESGVLVMSED